jgi:hypothetical protein
LKQSSYEKVPTLKANALRARQPHTNEKLAQRKIREIS